MISEPLSKKKCNVLVLGQGYIGTSIALSLMFTEEFNVKIASRQHVDYHDSYLLESYIEENHIDVVINAFGFTGRPNVDEAESKKELCWKLNVQIPLDICRLCNRIGVKYVHISSGCIYNGYDKVFTEEDKPNFGLFDYSSFYSKTKHAFELMSSDMHSKILRVRMPLSVDSLERNFVTKIKKYDNVISFRNSKTFLRDLEGFIKNLLSIEDEEFWLSGQDIYNVVNSNPLTTEEIMKIMWTWNYYNPNWKIVDEKDLKLAAPRSNCVLDNTKANLIYKMSSERDVIEEIVDNLSFGEKLDKYDNKS